MDPDANLRELRELASVIVNEDEVTSINATRLAELAIALDEWITAGGFLPAAWQNNER